MKYRITTDSVSTTVDASSDDEAAVKFAASERIAGVKGMASLLHEIAKRGRFVEVTDDRDDVVGHVNPLSGTITIYPQGR